MDKKNLTIIAGPCSAESFDQVHATAKALTGLNLTAFRSGIWKPRTRPGAFEGIGEVGLQWLRDIKAEFNMPLIIEVATPHHVELALQHGVDMVWIGARTTSNPFSVQELAESLKGIDMPVYVKNPTNPDVSLWIGAIERFQKMGVTKLTAIHRGFSIYEKRKYRNAPNWQIPIDLKRSHPSLPIICDPSHISGRAENIFEVAQKAMDLKFDGLMVETHISPDEALTDAKQQISPTALMQLIEDLQIRSHQEIEKAELQELRALLAVLDEQMIQLLSERMDVSRKIGHFKKRNNLAILQNSQWRESLLKNVVRSVASELSSDFSTELFKLIHQESIDIQSKIMGNLDGGHEKD